MFAPLFKIDLNKKLFFLEYSLQTSSASLVFPIPATPVIKTIAEFLILACKSSDSFSLHKSVVFKEVEKLFEL